MSTAIERINLAEYNAIVDTAKKNSVFVAEIDGKNVQNLNDYLEAVWKAFQFPDTGYVNYHAYLDWIRDLDWLNSDGYIFAICNPECFMEQSPRERQIIMDSLEKSVLPWWESEVEQYVVEGKAKPFNGKRQIKHHLSDPPHL